jgi:hypothetical protein
LKSRKSRLAGLPAMFHILPFVKQNGQLAGTRLERIGEPPIAYD